MGMLLILLACFAVLNLSFFCDVSLRPSPRRMPPGGGGGRGRGPMSDVGGYGAGYVCRVCECSEVRWMVLFFGTAGCIQYLILYLKS